MIVFVSSIIFFTLSLDAEAANPSSYSLIGTIISRGFVGAVINDTNGEQSFYRLHEVLPDGMQIVEVRSDSISLKGESGTRYDIYINHDIKTVGAASQSAYVSPSPPETAISKAKPVHQNRRRKTKRRPPTSQEE